MMMATLCLAQRCKAESNPAVLPQWQMKPENDENSLQAMIRG